MTDAERIRALIEGWADAVARGDRAGILAHHADDLLMFDFPDTVDGLAGYAKTWDFFDDSRRGPVTFRPSDIHVRVGGDVAFATCEVHCDGTTAGTIDFRLTTGFERRGGGWTITHEHHSMPTENDVLIGPDVTRCQKEEHSMKTANAAEREIEALVAAWANAVHRGELAAVLKDHAEDIVMFDVPPPDDGPFRLVRIPDPDGNIITFAEPQ